MCCSVLTYNLHLVYVSNDQSCVSLSLHVIITAVLYRGVLDINRAHSQEVCK